MKKLLFLFIIICTLGAPIILLNPLQALAECEIINENISPEQFESQWDTIIKEEKAKLNFDEMKIFYVGNDVYNISGNKSIKDLETLKKYYPNLNIPSQINDYEFEQVIVRDYISDDGKYITEKLDNTSDKVYSKVCKRDLLMENIQKLELTYIKNGKRLYLVIYDWRNFGKSHRKYIFEHYNIKEQNIKDDKFHITKKNKFSSGMCGIYKEFTIDNKMYGVHINNIDFSNIDGINIQMDIEYSEEDFKKELYNDIKQINIEKLVKYIGI